MPARSTASHASVVYLRIPEFATRAVAEEAMLKEHLENVAAGALPELNAGEWIILDASEGLAIVVLVNPRGALRFAWRASADADLAPAIGLAHGPVRVAQGQPPVLYGDALLAAEGAARATSLGKISVTRDFRDELTRSWPGMRRLLPRAGSAVDDQGRAFEIYRGDRGAVARRRRAFFANVGLIAAAIIGLGFAVDALRPPPPAPVAAAPAPPPAPAPEPLPGAVTFEIKPEGEVFVDGVPKGKSPPLKKIQVAAGNHVIEVRSARFKPFVTELAVGSGEEFAVEHNFVVKQPPKAPVKTIARPKPVPPAKPAPAKEKEKDKEKGAWDRFVDWFKGPER